MQEEMNQDNQKTIVSFVVGLLIGGLLVWAFSGPEDTHKDVEKESDDDSAMVLDEKDSSDDEMMVVGDGKILINDQPASAMIAIESAEYPVAEGWIGVRTYENGELTNILGVNRFSQSQGLVPEEIELVTPTMSGKTYAIVVYEEDGDFDFSLSGDRQLDVIFDTFTAE